jgi:hypothetical protein
MADVHKLALHPRNPMRLYATTHYGTFRSDDGATSWQSIGAGLPFEMTRPLALHPHDPDTPLGLFLGTNRGQLFASADEGDTWRQIADLGASVRVVRLGA